MKDTIRGKKLVFKFEDGPMASKSFEHAFHRDGSLDFGMPGGKGATHVDKYELADVGKDVAAVSYLSDSGYTLTTVLDFGTQRIVAFSSNAKELGIQHGTFEVVS
jgi:hypothetical protein